MNPVSSVVTETHTVLEDVWFILPNWKWLGILALIIFGFFLLIGSRTVFLKARKKLQSRFSSDSFIFFFLKQNLQRPLSGITMTGFWLFGWQTLDLPAKFEKSLSVLSEGLLSLFLISLIYMAAEALGRKMDALVRKSQNGLNDQLAPFATKTLKVVVIILGVLVVLQNFGVNVVSLLAGLGLGGLALALAAQDTVANVFGSITIILDKPFKVGDNIKVGETEGLVEELGFRSTRIRTGYKSLISIPNSIMAKEKIDNLSARPNRRFRQVIAVSFATPPAQVQILINQIRSSLEQKREVEKGSVLVALQAFGESSLNILVTCFLNVSVDEEPLVQQQILFDILTMTAQLKIDFGFPVQTVHHVLPQNQS